MSKNIVRFARKGFIISILMMTSSVLMALDQMTVPFEDILICDNKNGSSEEIYVAGTLRIKTQYVENKNNSTWVYHLFMNGQGEGLTSGAEYQWRGKVMEVFQANKSTVYLNNDWMPLIGKGGAENYMYLYRIRFVINANGEIVVDYFEANECVSVY